MTQSSTPAIVWLRRDLRLADNPALHAAATRHSAVIPVYIDTAVEGAAGRAWLAKSLAKLADAFRQHGSQLVLRSGEPLTELSEIARHCGATAVYWNRLYDPEIVERDKHIKLALRESGLEVQSFRASLLIEPWEVTTGSGGPYKVFTPFWRKVENQLKVPEPLSAPKLSAPADWPRSQDLGELNLEPLIPWDHGFWEHWSPGERGASERLAHFLSGPVSNYRAGRDIPADDSVSGLSPHIHFGEISPVTIWHAAIAVRHSAPGDTNWFLRELGWREFAHHVLFHFPNTPASPLNAKYENFPWRENYQPLLRAWQQGQTGIPLVDAGMRELWQTGWMHNRVRMIVASFLVKNLRAPWQTGAEWFLDTLTDADLASNTLGWQWAAGCGADAAPYFRVFNPVLQGKKFDKAGDYVRRYVPELRALSDKYLHEPWQMPAEIAQAVGFELGRDYPQPVVDLKKSRDEALAALKLLTNSES